MTEVRVDQRLYCSPLGAATLLPGECITTAGFVLLQAIFFKSKKKKEQKEVESPLSPKKERRGHGRTQCVRRIPETKSRRRAWECRVEGVGRGNNTETRRLWLMVFCRKGDSPGSVFRWHCWSPASDDSAKRLLICWSAARAHLRVIRGHFIIQFKRTHSWLMT